MKRSTVLSLGLLASGCAMDFAPASLLDEARVLALIPNPIEIDLRDLETQLEIRAARYVPITSTITASRWSFCPISSGVRGSFACVLPACQIELAEVSTGLVRVSPARLAAECLERLEGSGLPVLDASGQPPESFESSFLHRMETSAGTTVEAVARVRAYLDNPPSPPRGHPSVVRVLIGGQPMEAPGDPLVVREGESLEIEIEVTPGVGSAVEELYTSYFATAGRFESLRTDLALGRNTWTAEELNAEDRSSTLYFVTRDGNGGQAVAGPFSVEILRSAP